jgi:hypothetical protein
MATRAVTVILATSAAIVAAVAILLRPTAPGPTRGEPPSPTRSSSPSPSTPELGVRPEAADPARLSRDSSTRQLASTPRPDRQLPELPAAPPAPPQPPIVPSAAAIAESEEIQAASPPVLAALEQSLASKRAAVRAACWTGDVPASARFPVEASYSAEGTVLAVSVGDDPAAPGVGACVREQPALAPPSIEPPGVAVTVTAALALP